MPFNQLFEIGSLTVRNPGSRYQAYRKPLTIAKVLTTFMAPKLRKETN